jgi:hypothetical protein
LRFYTTGLRDPKAVPEAVVTIQTFGDFLGFHPHLHILISDGCFYENGMFSVSPAVDIKALAVHFDYIYRIISTKNQKGKPYEMHLN